MASRDVDVTLFLIHHVALPPKLPQKDDSEVCYEQALLTTTVEALQNLGTILERQYPKAALQVASVRSTIHNLISSRNSDGYISESQLAKLLGDVAAGTSSGVLPLEVKAQNAGILVSRHPDTVVFEVFELSPLNETVMSTKGRLIRSFPTHACQISIERFREKGLIEALSNTIAKLSIESVPEFQPQVRKAGMSHDEYRNTADPTLVTDYLVNVLSALGHFVDIGSISKNTREDVLWCNAMRPWRRSPVWLLIRVAMQLQFARAASASSHAPSENLYKVVMINLLASILAKAEQHNATLSSDLLQAVSAKLASRLRKLKRSQIESLEIEAFHTLCTSTACTILTDTHKSMEMKWQDSMTDNSTNVDMSVIGIMQPGKALEYKLPDMDDFIKRIYCRVEDNSNSKFRPSWTCPTFSQDELPCDFGASGDHRYFQLAAIEEWVERHLATWLAKHIVEEDTCERLGRLMQTYHDYANPIYSSDTDPRSISVMYLTLAELWVACDSCACNVYDLLKQYDPEIRIEVLQSLSLPFKSQLERVAEVEHYVKSRRGQAQQHNPSLFRNFAHRDSFAVRYFDRSSEHQLLKARVEEEAKEQRQRKRQELATKKQSHLDLTTRADLLTCEYIEVVVDDFNNFTKSRHSDSCRKCDLQSQAKMIQVQVHEWPLSPKETEAKATIFELQIPSAFSSWRDNTMYFQMDILGFTYHHEVRAGAAYTLQGHEGLNGFLSIASGQRIALLSKVKPHAGSHYQVKQGTSWLNNSDVCLDSALRYRYYDSKERVFTAALRLTELISKKCTYQLPNRSSSLQWYLRTPITSGSVTPNDVMASVNDCPLHFSLEEYKAFGVLPIGYNIQYANILTQLAMPAVDFAKVETQCLLLQTIHLVGPPSKGANVERLAHQTILDDSFCCAIMKELELSLRIIAENWEVWRSLATFIQLALRVLGLTRCPQARSRCLAYLQKTRQITLSWLDILEKRLITATNDAQRSELRSRTTEIALLCVNTIDAEYTQLDDILGSTAAVYALIRCSITIRECKDASSSEHLPLFHTMLQSWRSLLFRVYLSLRDGILHGEFEKDLNKAVAASWTAFRPSGEWRSLDNPHHHWIQVECNSLDVHLNLLTAELLVNGLPLSRLPQQYTQHKQYASLLRQSFIEVVPTNEPGMAFDAKHVHEGNELSFGMQGQDLLLVAARGKDEKFDLIPPRFFEKILPTVFVQDFIHWYNHCTKEVEFRPRNVPWSSDKRFWHLKTKQSSWHLVQGQSCLINPASGYGRELSRIFAAIEGQSHLHISFERPTSTVSIDLPRLRLGFHISHDSTQIHSRQYRGMIIDEDQQIGTLVGLASKLVLKHIDGIDDRVVLIPEGPVRYNITANHVSVSITADTSISTHLYQLDKTLGRIVDNGSLQSKLFLCYLHALTSHCLPDILTGYTGTEAALSILRSAAVASFDLLTGPNLELLKLIAGLTPKRYYYPQHLRVMQKVQWNACLSVMSQHPELYLEVEVLFRKARRVKLFYPKDDYIEPVTSDIGDLALLRRDMVRSSTFRVDEFGAEHYTTVNDVKHEMRPGNVGHRGLNAFIASSLILRDRPTLHCAIEASNFQQSLRTNHLKDATVKGTGPQLQGSTLKFGTKWLQKPSTFLPGLWCDLQSSLSTSPQNFNKFDIMMWLSSTAFAADADMDLIQAFAAFYKLPELAVVAPPPAPIFGLSNGDSPSFSDVNDLVQGQRQYQLCPEANLPQITGETSETWRLRKHKLFRTNQKNATEAFARAVHAQWPHDRPTKPVIESADVYIDTSTAMNKIYPKWKIWYENRRFFDYIRRVSTLVGRQQVIRVPSECYLKITPLQLPSRAGSFRTFCVQDIFALTAPVSLLKSSRECSTEWPQPPKKLELPLVVHTVSEHEPLANDRLDAFCCDLSGQAASICEIDYVSDLRASCKSLADREIEAQIDTSTLKDTTPVVLKTYSEDCEEYFLELHTMLECIVRSGDEITTGIGHSPRVPPIFWLQQLNRVRFDTLTVGWKKVIVAYGLAITELHRARRLLALSQQSQDLATELQNRGHLNWDPLDYPETLLLEAESGIMVREVQAEIGKQMRSPPEDKNSVMQLNMGEGKSSVIVPMVAITLADTTRLVRVIVAKSQSKQMLQMLVSKVGGLLNRRIYHMPFSRALKISTGEANAIGEICHDCMENRGILLVQPEHILSFQLMGIECLVNGHNELARSLLQTQELFNTTSRDIVDESDENFSVKFELVYTMGLQTSIEMSPKRWSIIHSVLWLVARYAPQVKDVLPSSIEISNRCKGRCSRIRILREDANDMLLDLVTKHICKDGCFGLTVMQLPKPVRDSIYRYIRECELTSEKVRAVEEGDFWADDTKDSLMLVRGLIAGGILRFALGSKRWRVNYGTDLSRMPKTKLAVPYRSKDSPSPRSEFSHPDVVIVLTSLTYYYRGLDDEELFDTFAHLLKSDQANAEYDEWVRYTADLPEAFRLLVGINIKDKYQCTSQVFPRLRYSKGAIDYFLSYIVFPKEMKQFPHKLSASGWDLGAIKPCPTTGFSGTNDSRHVLPLSVEHLDLEQQKHTNALVLACLLQDENSVELLPSRDASDTTDAEQLIKSVLGMEIPTRVILDVGAQILELNNYQVAETWLRMSDSSTAKAVVFFDPNEELSVLDRNGRVEILQTSAFAKHLGDCLVYLDEAHTRGTDLKLPKMYRAAVTLGANLTKDRLVQACMRMRRLGKGQSIVFCVPEEIQARILERQPKLDASDIQVRNVLMWAVTETWVDLRRSMPSWATQGRRYEDHKHLWNGVGTTPEQAEQLLEEEAQSVEHRYRPRLQSGAASFAGWNTSNHNIGEIIKRCQAYTNLNFDSSTLQEEQERELSPEIEEERQIQRPPPMEAEEHVLHPDLLSLIRTTKMPFDTKAILPAFRALVSTSLAKHFFLAQFPVDLLVTADFISTVKRPAGLVASSSVVDSYLRPVQWILSVVSRGKHPAVRRLVILSPFEADQLWSRIPTLPSVTLHLYSPRPNLGFTPLDHLNLYCIGHSFSPNTIARSVIVQLNLFAGQLYFGTYDEYKELCDFLGLAYAAAEAGQKVQADGFVLSLTGRWGFKTSPVRFLRELMKIRREGESIDKTQIGRLLDGTFLEEAEFGEMK